MLWTYLLRPEHIRFNTFTVIRSFANIERRTNIIKEKNISRAGSNRDTISTNWVPSYDWWPYISCGNDFCTQSLCQRKAYKYVSFETDWIIVEYFIAKSANKASSYDWWPYISCTNELLHAVWYNIRVVMNINSIDLSTIMSLHVLGLDWWLHIFNILLIDAKIWILIAKTSQYFVLAALSASDILLMVAKKNKNNIDFKYDQWSQYPLWWLLQYLWRDFAQTIGF